MSDPIELTVLEARIDGAFWDMCEALYAIQNGRLYSPDYVSFEDYLLSRWDGRFNYNTWRQWRASYEAYMDAMGAGVMLSNENAARAFRRVERSIRTLVLRKAAQYSGKQVVSASDIIAAAQEIETVLQDAITTGYVDAGDGTMTGFEAAVDTAIHERIMRQKQHIADGYTSRGWSDPSEFIGGRTWTLFLNGKMAYVDLTALPPRAKIELRWRIIEQETTAELSDFND